MTGPEATPRPTGSCEICGQEGFVHRDHDHATGFIRGILCASCNHGLARFKDDPELVEAALEFLRKESGAEGYLEWRRARHAEAERRRYEAIRRRPARADRYREKYATDAEYRAKKLADNEDYRRRAGISS